MTISVQSYLTKKKDQFAAGVAGATGNTVTPPPNGQGWAANQNAAPVNQDVATKMPTQPTTYIEQPKPAATMFSSVSGDNAKAYIDEKSKTLGQDPGYTTEAGSIYAQRTTDGLKTPDASSVNAQNTQDTAASRRAYLTRMQADEAIGQSGYGAGTAQADRIRSNATSQIDSANQAGQNSVNAYLRQRTEDNMNRARDLEASQHIKGRENLQDVLGQDYKEYAQSEKATDRGLAAKALVYSQGRDVRRDEEWDTTHADSRTDKATADSQWNTTHADQVGQQAIDNAHWDTMNADQKEQRAIENAAVLKGADEAAKRNLLAGLPDGPAKNKVMQGLADGSLTLQNALASVFDSSGAIKEEYAGKTPGALGLEAEKEYAQQTVDLQFPDLKKTNMALYTEKVNAEILAKRQASNQPINDAQDASVVKGIRAKLAKGEVLDPKTEIPKAIESGLIPPVNPATVPTGPGEVQTFLQENPSGYFSVEGEVYKMVKGDTYRTGYEKNSASTAINILTGSNVGETAQNARHTDFAEVTNTAGQTKYFYDGSIHDAPPVKG